MAQLPPSPAQLLHSPLNAVVQSDLVQQQTADGVHLVAPVDPKLIVEPANVVRPDAQGRVPRRLSISDRALLERALAEANAASNRGSVSRPSSANASTRHGHRMRTLVPTRQSIGTHFAGAKQPLSEEATEVFCLAYSPDSERLVAGCGDGSLRVFSSGVGVENRLQRVLYHDEDREHLPVTCIRFHPRRSTSGEHAGDHLLLVATADGCVSHWNINDNSDATACVRTFREPTSSVYALDIQTDGAHFATGGRDHIVRIYNNATGQLVRTCENPPLGVVGGGAQAHAHGHSNRIFAVKYHPTEAHLLLTGGWDNLVLFWDDRTGRSVRSIYGPHLCGDALACSALAAKPEILTASWREENALQRWDLGTGKLIENVAWNGTPPPEDATAGTAAPLAPVGGPSCMLYACAYSPDETVFAAGGAGNGVNQAKLFALADASASTSSYPIERVSLQHALYTLAFSPDGRQLALGGVDANLTLVNL